jgi:hypothetical protein
MTLIKEWLENGSVHEAIIDKKISLTEVLQNFDSIHSYSQKISCIIALISNFPCTYLYLPNGTHLLYSFQEDKLVKYLFILTYSTEMYDVPTLKDDHESSVLLYLILDLITSENLCYEYSLAKYLLGLSSSFVPNENWANIVLCQNHIPLPLRLTNEQCYENYILSDCIQSLPTQIYSYISLIQSRLNYIKNICPLYYQYVYTQYQEKFSSTNLYGATKDQIHTINSLFPGLFTKWIHSVNDDVFPLCTLPLPIQSYLLGFDIQKGLPTQKQIDNEIYIMNHLGLEKYWLYHIPHLTIQTVANTNNTLMDEVGDYLHFDQYRITSPKVFQFTRQEFDQLLNKKINFWNKCKLDTRDLLNLEVRVGISKIYSLPKADTWMELMKKCKEGTLFTSTSEEEDITKNLFSNLIYLTNLRI